MLKFELKKIFSKPVNRIVLAVLLILVLAGSFLAIRDVRYVPEDGTPAITGVSAACHLKREKSKWAGTVTPEVLRKTVKAARAVNGSWEPDSEINFSKKQGFSDLANMLNWGFSGPKEFDYYKMDSLSPEKAAALYDSRIPMMNDYLKSGQEGTFSEAETDYLNRQYEKLETPLKYAYADGWKTLLNSGAGYLPTLLIIVTVITGFLTAGIFSDEFQLKADSVFFSAKLGRGKAVKAKILAGFLTVTIVYWSAMLLFSGIILAALGFGGGNCMIQIEEWWSMYNLTYIQEWLAVMFGGYIGILFILTLAMLVSAGFKSTAAAVAVPFALSCAPMFLGRISILTDAMNFFPDMLLRFSTNISDFILYGMGGKAVSVYSILFPLYLILFLAAIPVLYRIYTKSEVN